jgi:hypothetical protein
MPTRQRTASTSKIRLKGLIIADPWFTLIVRGKKIWEMRSTATHFRGPLAVIRKGSGAVGGIVEVIDCLAGQSETDYAVSEARHCVPSSRHRECAERWPFAWVLANARPLTAPVRYKHKRGAQSWVILSPEESLMVMDHDPFALAIDNNENRLALSNTGVVQ